MTPTPSVKEEIMKSYEDRFLKKRKLSDGSSSEYIHLKGTALDKDFRDFVTSSLTLLEQETIKAERNRIKRICEEMKKLDPVQEDEFTDEELVQAEIYRTAFKHSINELLKEI